MDPYLTGSGYRVDPTYLDPGHFARSGPTISPARAESGSSFTLVLIFLNQDRDIFRTLYFYIYILIYFYI
jgi:hypothetical protein